MSIDKLVNQMQQNVHIRTSVNIPDDTLGRLDKLTGIIKAKDPKSNRSKVIAAILEEYLTTSMSLGLDINYADKLSKNYICITLPDTLMTRLGLQIDNLSLKHPGILSSTVIRTIIHEKLNELRISL